MFWLTMRITQDTLMLKMTEEDFEKVLKVNLTGCL